MQSTLPIIILITTANCLCSKSNTTLLSANNALACGEHNGSIYLIGGYVDQNRRQLTQYLLEDKSMNDLQLHGKDTITVDTYGFGQFYTQTGSNLYMIANDNTFSVFNMESTTFENWNPIVTPIPISTNGCLASTADLLFFVGGWTPSMDPNDLNTVQVFNISSQSWISAPDMLQRRVDAACLVHNDRLYAIAGKEGSVYLKSFESMDINQSIWSIVGDLLYEASMLRCISYSDSMIWCVGGENVTDSASVFLNAIQVIDTTTNSVTVSEYTLQDGVDTPAVIVLNHILYVFGGRTALDAIDTVQYCDIQISSTTEPYTVTLDSTTQFPTTTVTMYSSNIASSDVTTTINIDANTNGTVTSIAPSDIITTVNVDAEKDRNTTVTIHGSDIASSTVDNDDDKDEDIAVTMYSSYMTSSDIINTIDIDKNKDENISIGVIVVMCICLGILLLCIGKYLVGISGMSSKLEAARSVDSVMIEMENDGPITNGCGQIVNEDNVVAYRKDSMALREVRSWLEDDVKLPNYYELFIQNGYDTMNTITEIKDDSELIEIGISCKSHCVQILNAINDFNRERREKVLEGVEEVTNNNEKQSKENVHDGEDGLATANNNEKQNDENGHDGGEDGLATTR